MQNIAEENQLALKMKDTGSEAKCNFTGLKHCKNGLMIKTTKMLEAMKQGKEPSQDPYMHKTYNMVMYMQFDMILDKYYSS